MNGLQNAIKYVLGNKQKVESEQYFLTLVTITAGFLLIALFFMHLYFRYSDGPIIVSGVSMLVLFFLYYLVRIKGKVFITKLVLTIYGLAALDFTWYVKFMSIGPILYFVFAFGALIVWVWNGRMLFFLLTIYICNILLLYILENTHLDRLSSYPDFATRSQDIYISFTLYSFLLIFLFQKIKEDFNREKERAIKSDLMKSAFLANMSHEIRTPMNAIVGFSELLIDENDAEKRAQYIQIIQSSSGNLLKLINEIVDLSKIEAGEMSLSLSTFSIKAVFEEMMNIYSIELVQRNKSQVKLSYELPTGDFYVFSDPYRLKQILSNLLNNAVKHTNAGEIIATCQLKKNELHFSVSDTGTGIPIEDQEKIFDRFTKFNYLNNNSEGTGIGLSIVEKLVGLLSGEIWLKSAWEKGSVFYFKIPYTKAKNQITAAQDIQHPIEKVTTVKENALLIVEDDEINTLLLREMLKAHFKNYVHVKNGKEAIDWLQSGNNCELILMDMNMPVLNGYDATRLIKEEFPNIKIIAQTANAVMGDKQKSIDAGCDEYLSKPIDQSVLIQTIHRMLRDETIQ
jgi:signal transduction histidine kinase/ActR/RegA family two-component response regulator